MVTVPFPGSGASQSKLAKRGKSKPRASSTPIPIAVGETLEVSITDPGYFSHDFSDVFSPDLPTGFFAPVSLIVSAPAAGLGNTITLFYVDLKNNKRYEQELIVASKTKTPKKKTPPAS